MPAAISSTRANGLAARPAPVVTPASLRAQAPSAAGAASSRAATVSLGKKPEPSATYPRPAPAATPPTPNVAPNNGPKPLSTEGGSIVAGSGAVVVDIMNSESGYDNKIYWSSDNWKTKHQLGVDNHTSTTNLGTFAPGTKIQFGIDNGQGDFFKTGSGAQNSDGIVHANVKQVQGGFEIGFEDLRGGGDRDFNDAIIRVRSVAEPPAAAPPAAAPPPAKPKPEQPHDNRSGLGDGTNPGQGSGRANSPNAGTANPSQAQPRPAPAAPPPTPNPSVEARPASPAPPPGGTRPANPPSAATKPASPNPPPGATKPSNPKASAPLPKPGNNQPSRSGLADGTNPGQGAGRVNSPNVGTANPNQAASRVVVPPSTPKANQPHVRPADPKPAQTPTAPSTSQVRPSDSKATGPQSKPVDPKAISQAGRAAETAASVAAAAARPDLHAATQAVKAATAGRANAVGKR